MRWYCRVTKGIYSSDDDCMSRNIYIPLPSAFYIFHKACETSALAKLSRSSEKIVVPPPGAMMPG